MDFLLSAEHDRIREKVSQLVESFMAVSGSIDDFRFHQVLLKEFGRQGWSQLFLPGQKREAGYLGAVLALEEVARVNVLSALLLAAHLAMGCGAIAQAGTEAQKERYLVPGVAGDKLISFALTEPGAGSDIDCIETSAAWQDDTSVLTGAKSFVMGAGAADTYIVAARSEGPQGAGISLFIVEKDMSGLETGRTVPVMGFQSLNTGELFLNHCHMPKNSLLGQVGGGTGIISRVSDNFRVLLGAVAIGLAEACVGSASRYAKERVQFGQPIHKFQAITFYLADMAAEIEAARVLVYGAASRKDGGLSYSKEAAMGKYYAAEVALKCAIKAVQVHGARGLTDDFPVEGYLRAAKILEIVGGTTEAQKVLISSHLSRAV